MIDANFVHTFIAADPKHLS